MSICSVIYYVKGILTRFNFVGILRSEFFNTTGLPTS